MRAHRQSYVRLSYVMTALTGQPVTAAQLLGEPEPKAKSPKDVRAEELKAERKMERMLRELEKRREGPCQTL